MGFGGSGVGGYSMASIDLRMSLIGVVCRKRTGSMVYVSTMNEKVCCILSKEVVVAVKAFL